MSFQNMFPRKFSTASIRAYAPATSGVYGISNAREWILIGTADDIQRRLLEHLAEGDESRLKRCAPTGFAFEVCDPAGRDARQDCLVTRYEPVCNRMPHQAARGGK
jgi:hypothetical protein